MIITNTTDKDVSIVIKGHPFKVLANDKLAGLSMEDAVIWKRTHGFLIINEEEVVAIKARDYPKETVIPEIKEEPKEVSVVKKSIFSKPVKK